MDVSEITVRRAAAEDAEAIEALERLSFPIPWSLDSILKEIEKNELARFFAAEQNGRVIAYAGAWYIAPFEYDIANVAVHPEYRRMGVGRLIMRGLIEAAENEGAEDITLEVRPSNTAAIRLYEGLGFREEGRRRAYYTDGEDAIIMWRRGAIAPPLK